MTTTIDGLEYHAVTGWSAKDVQTLKPAWSDERCFKFLDDHADTIIERMVESGWSAIHDIINESYREE
jgi:hypothetical protein